MADVTISSLSKASKTTGEAYVPVSNAGVTYGIPVSSILYTDSTTIKLLSSTLVWDSVPTGAPATLALQLNNSNIQGINQLAWGDIGPWEGLLWAGTTAQKDNWSVFVCPDDLTDNTSVSGNLQFVQGNQIANASRRMTLQQDGQLSVYGTVSAQKSISLDGVSNLAWTGYSAGNQTITHKVRPNIGGPFKIEAMFSHYGYVNSYGSTWYAVFALGGSPWTIKDITSYYNSNNNNSGNWDVSWDGTYINITKSAGTYNGQGYYWIKLSGINMNKIS